MKLLISLLIITAANGQTAGTVVQSTTSNIVATAGTLVCTLTNTTPALPSGIHVVCLNSGLPVLALDTVVPAGQNGMVGFLTIGTNTITWIVNQPAAPGFAWQMAANGVGKSGTF